jgi:hypothetical protein
VVGLLVVSESQSSGKETSKVYKVILTQVIAQGKGEEDRAYREASQRIFDRLGVPRKVWSVEGRKVGQILIEFGPFDSREESKIAQGKLRADEELQDLQRKWIESGVGVPGTSELFILTD